MRRPTKSAPAVPARGPRVAGPLVVVVVLAALVLDLVVAPPDAIQGQSQRLMYLHVPSAWTAFCCFGVVFVASVGVLLRRGPTWDAYGRAAAELGVGMTALAIMMGSLWGHTVWGVWWTWDARLVSTAVLLLLYVGYLGVRGLPAGQGHASRRAAVVGVVAFAQVPVVHFSVLWWRTLHQPPTLLAPSTSPPIAPLMLTALLVSLLASTLAAFWFITRRVPQLLAADAVAEQPDDEAPAPALVITRGVS